jgi:hypothetical protein
VTAVHQAPGHLPVACTRDRFGTCPLCAALDPADPGYNPDLHRRFHPEAFPDPAPPVAPAAAPPEVVVAPADPLAAIPLAGDLVREAAQSLGADRLARYVAAKLGVDCGCERRRLALNRLDAALRAFVARRESRPADG